MFLYGQISGLYVLYQNPNEKTEKAFLAVIFFMVMRYPPNHLLLATTKSKASQPLALDF